MEALISNYRAYVKETRPEALKPLFEGFLHQCAYEVVGFTEKYFEPQGYTCVWILAESHLALHTFPEFQKTYVELSSCNLQKNDAFVECLSSQLFPEEVSH
jgi:S-adenosylmethionine/arginine decarboxylase-like enzyme